MKHLLLLLAMAGQLPGDEQKNDGSPSPTENSAAQTSYFLIGNSLTWDTVPSWLEGDVQWHVDCGKSLQFIHDNPEMPCVKSSTLWPQALKDKQYDFVSVQPHYGSTLKQDIDVISSWVDMQPKAIFVIHSGWAHHEKRETEYRNRIVTDRMQHSPAYMAALLEALRKQYPHREFRETRAIELLQKVAEDIAAGKAPFRQVADLHRDKIHMKLETGRYLMHNCMRRAMGQQSSAAHHQKTPLDIRNYLDTVLNSLPSQPDNSRG